MEDSFSLGGWVVEPALNRVVRQSEVVQLEPRVMDLLVVLARRPGEVLSRETLIDTVWQRHVVGEAVLRNAIAALRRALGDRADDPTYIETISKRGYRLIAPVTGLAVVASRPATTASCFTVSWEDHDVALAEGDNLIGRGPDAQIRIDNPEVSRRHARLTVAGETVTLEDLGSKNGTHRNGRRLDRPVRLSDGDEIWIGLNLAALRFRVCDDPTKTER
jgi:DNA-binding winged helix-turn-helix (wHTH) protein